MKFKHKYKWTKRDQHFLALQREVELKKDMERMFSCVSPFFSVFTKITGGIKKSDFCMFEYAHSDIQSAMNQEDGTTNPSNFKSI